MKICKNCGKCCIGSPCGMASIHNGRCVAIVKSSNKYWCSLIINANEKEKANLIYILKIGEGCHLWA